MTYKEKQAYAKAIEDFTANLLRNSRTEVIDGKISLIVTEDRIRLIEKEMLRGL